MQTDAIYNRSIDAARIYNCTPTPRVTSCTKLDVYIIETLYPAHCHAGSIRQLGSLVCCQSNEQS